MYIFILPATTSYRAFIHLFTYICICIYIFIYMYIFILPATTSYRAFIRLFDNNFVQGGNDAYDT